MGVEIRPKQIIYFKKIGSINFIILREQHLDGGGGGAMSDLRKSIYPPLPKCTAGNHSKCFFGKEYG